MGYAIVSFGWFYLHHGVPNREYYSAPSTVGEWIANPDEIYSDWSAWDDPQYDGMTAPTNKWRWQTSMRRRIRFIANMIASFLFGLAGGFVAVKVLSK